jgi:hypothetical protein
MRGAVRVLKPHPVLAAGVLLVIGCHLSLDSGALPLVRTAESLTLQWDPPPYDLGPVTRVVSYNVYYRKHGGASWSLLQTTPATPAPEATLNRSLLGNGSFDFAVTAVNSLGESSPVHSSLDANAFPPGGWYVVWD